MTREEDVGKANSWLQENLPEVVAFLKTAVKTHEKRSEKPEKKPQIP